MQAQALDRFSWTLSGELHRTPTCERCGRPSINELCRDCRTEQYIEHAGSLSPMAVMEKLTEIFEGEWSQVYVNHGQLVIRFYGTSRTLSEASRLLQARDEKFTLGSDETGRWMEININNISFGG
ncbi:hypothetical protein GJ688_01890 [Heliobacillus mobilis]|uniref:Uncharacterized protein n=1 Tax=Heliobacterium mobile TaxID=28064 RepID=A0A6I3SC47_HELMO|nr:hypothetical protein [Heliobacterium mobile]MTV47733.1 hypothetical protein [Heliobacterium mobile]